MTTFTMNGKQWQISDGGRFRVQVAGKQCRHRWVYITHTENLYFEQAVAAYNGINVAIGSAKRLSYKASTFGRYVELTKFIPTSPTVPTI